MKDFRELKVWSKAHTFIPANISEACGRSSDADFTRFLSIAMGSASELEYLFILVLDLSLIDLTTHAEVQPLIVETKKMLYALIAKLRGLPTAKREPV
jgi:four helix bundle protein